MLFFYKVVNNHVRLTLDSRVPFSPNLLTSFSRTNLFQFSFMKRIVGECNSLPFDIREASPVEDFKLEVCTFLTV